MATLSFSRAGRAIFAAVAALAFIGIAAAEARPGKGGSFGSRGDRTYSAPPPTATAPNGELTGNVPAATVTKSDGSATTRNRICVEYCPFQSTPAFHVIRLSVPPVTAPTAPVADVTGTVHVTPPSEDTCNRTLIGPFTRDKS